jgi:hypothetical protein
MFGRKTTLTLSAIITSAALAFGAGTLQAASQCKGLDKGACERNAECSWVDSYTRKDGVKVSGHCRSKGGKK